MRLSKLSIRNFRNFRSVEIPLSGNVVLLGENRVGKSNLLYAIRLILEARCLFYVGVTRPRKELSLIYQKHHHSPWLEELFVRSQI
jgi:predicted ATP-dependent endonuclease of OLD family